MYFIKRKIHYNGALNRYVHTVTPRYNAVVGRHLLGPPYKRGALRDPVDLFDIIIPRQRKDRPSSQRLEVELELE